LLVLDQGGLTGTRYTSKFANEVYGGSVLNVSGTTYYFAGAYANGYYYSTDKVNWTGNNPGGNGGYARCVYNGSQFVASQFYSNYIRHGTSIGSITNSNFVNGNGHAVCDMAVDPTNKIWTYLIGLGTNQFVYCTTNATQGGWTQFTGPTNPDGYWYCNRTVNGMNVLAGPGGTKIAYKSGDVSVNDWTIGTVPQHSVREIQYFNGLYFMLMGEVTGSQATPRFMYSPNLVTWTLAANYPANYWSNNGIRENYTGTGDSLTYDGVAAIAAVSNNPTLIISK
jgi:hypothetical protein